MRKLIQENQNLLIVVLFSMILVVVFLLVSKITYSFMGPDISDPLRQEGEILTKDGTLVFNPGAPLKLQATSGNFYQGHENLSSSTKPTITYTFKNHPENQSTEYYVGFRITGNTYKYTSGTTAEVILTIKDESGKEIEKIENLTHVNTNGVSGFDITNKNGLFNVDLKHPITITDGDSATHTWTFTLTFVNLETDQSLNENANLDLEIIFKKDAPEA